MYEWVEGWGRPPEGARFGYTHGVVVDSKDNVYVHNQSKDAVAVFDREGRFLGSWGEEFTKGAHGMYLSREGGEEYLYLADPARHLVAKATLDGRVLRRWGVPERAGVYTREDQYRPTDVAVAPGGDIYVCDGYGQSWVHQYDAGGEWIRSFGGPAGAEAGHLSCPHGIWVDTRGPAPLLLVADRGNRRIQTFTLEGKHVGFVTEGMRQPCCFYQFGDELFIPDLHGRVTVLDRDNHVAAFLGDDPGVWERAGWPNVPVADRRVGHFVSPHAACVDSHGDLYVVEWVADGRVTKLARV